MEAQILVLAFLVALVLVHVMTAISVVLYGLEYRRTIGMQFLLVPLWLWCFASLLGGLLVGSLFWLLHCSMLNPFVHRRAMGGDT